MPSSKIIHELMAETAITVKTIMHPMTRRCASPVPAGGSVGGSVVSAPPGPGLRDRRVRGSIPEGSTEIPRSAVAQKKHQLVFAVFARLQ